MPRISITKSINFVSPEGSPFRGEAEAGGSGYKADAGDVANAAVAVVAANQPPAVSNLDGDVTSWSEHSAPTLLDTGSSAALTDADSPNFDGGSLTVSIGTGLVAAQDQLLIRATSGISTTGSAVTYNGVQIGTFTGGGAGGSALVISFDPDATVTAVQSLLRAIGFDNSGGDNPVAGTRTINWTLIDGDGGSDTLNITSSVNVVAVNDAPVVGGLFATRTFTEGVNGAADHILVASATTFSDVDSASLAFVRVSITNNFVAAEDVLAFTNTNSTTFGDIAGNYDSNTGVLTLTSPGGAATVAQFQAAARAVTYDNVSEEPTQNNRTVQVLANDGAANGSLSFFIQVVAQNDSPSGTSSTIASNEDTVLTLTTAHLGFTDVDGDALSGVRFGQGPTGGTLYFDSDGAGGAAPIAITSFPTTTYTAADITAGKLTFVPTANLAGNGAASINFAVVDNGGTTGAGQNTDISPETLTINLTAVDDPPVVVSTNVTRTFTEGVNGAAAAIVVDNAVTVSDIDHATFGAVQVIIVGGYVIGEDVLAFVNNNAAAYGNISASYDTEIGFLTLSSAGGTATQAQFQAALRAVTYNNVSEEPSTGDRTLQIRALNGFYAISGGNFTLQVVAQNDSPSGTSSTISSNEDAVVTLTAAHLGFTDVDGDSLSGVRFSQAPSGGTLYYDSDGAGGAAPVAITSFPTTTYSAADIVAGKLTFVPISNLNGNGAASITFTVVDNGGTAGNGRNADVSPETLTINLAAVNDTPQGSDATITLGEDGSRTLTQANFGFGDPVEDDDFAGVVITTLPTDGSLLLNGVPITVAGTFVTAAQIDANQLVFQPDSNENGTSYASFTFQVRDSGGGADTDLSPNTLSFNVTAVNDAPVIGNLNGDSGTFTENGPAVKIDSGALATIVDVDSANFAGGTLSISVPTENNDQLQFGPNADLGPGATFLYGGTVIGTYAFVNGAGLDFVISLNENATPAILQGLIRDFAYFNNSNVPVAGTRTFAISLVDGDGNGGIVGSDTGKATATINVVAVNDAPSGADNSAGVLDNGILTFSAASFSTNSFDVDGNGFGGVRISTLPTAASGILYYDPDGVSGDSHVAVEAGDDFSAADLAAGRLFFDPAPGTAGTSPTFTFQMQDNGGTANGGQDLDQSPNTFTINIAESNSAPVADLNAGTAGLNDTNIYAEGGSGSGIGADIVVSDVDGGNLQGASITISDPSAEDALFVTEPLPGGITVSVSSTATNLILVGAASPAAYAAALGQVGYRNSGENPTVYGANPDRVINVTVNDGIADSLPATMTMSVFAVNDAPVNALGATVTIGEDSADEWLSGMSISDPDANPATDVMYFTFQVTSGSIEIRTDVSGGIEEGDIIAQAVDTITVMATLNEVNATLAATNGLTYTPNPNFNGDDTLTVYTNDAGATGSDPGLTGDGTSEEDVSTRTISVSASEDVAVLADDSATTDEASIVTIDVLANDGDDVDGPNQPGGQKPLVIEIGGQDVAAGETVTLGSGAKVTFNSDGTLTYNPNGAFNALVAASSGAANGSAEDIFTYTVAGGAQANVTVTVNGLESAGDIYRGDDGSNTITGTDSGNFFIVSQGGNDDLSGNGGNDVFLFGPSLTGVDAVDGGQGQDQIAIQGDYSDGLTFGAGIVSVESLAILPGSDIRFGDPGTNFYDYDLTTVDENVAAGATMVVDANRLRIDEDLTFDGSAESDGAFFIYGGRGTDSLTGGAMNDTFYFGEGLQFGAGDHVDGGSGGTDQLGLRGDYSITFGADQLVSIESIGLVSAYDTRFGAQGTRYDYNLTMNDGNVLAGQQMTVDAAPLREDETLTFDGSAELDGSFRIFGGQGNDSITGSRGDDRITGGFGGDNLRGGGGNDIFVYRSLLDSLASGNRDGIQDFTTGDKIDLSAIDGIDGVAGSAFSFIGDTAFSGTAGELRASNNGGIWTVSGDVDGDKVADILFFVIRGDADPIVGTDFVL